MLIWMDRFKIGKCAPFILQQEANMSNCVLLERKIGEADLRKSTLSREDLKRGLLEHNIIWALQKNKQTLLCLEAEVEKNLHVEAPATN